FSNQRTSMHDIHSRLSETILRIKLCAAVFAVLFAMALGAPFTMLSQSFTASLQGTVQDQTGGLIPGASVVVENEATNVRRETTTNETGRYFVTSLPPGSYKLTVAAPGFTTSVRAGMVLQVQQQ